MKKPPTISIIIPAKKDTKLSELIPCLNALTKQTDKHFNITIITDQQTAKNLTPLTKKYTFTSLLLGHYTKPQARNAGAKHSKGKYLLHLDTDYILDPQTLELCQKTIQKQKTKTIIINEKIAQSKNIWQKARQLERKITLQDTTLAAPQLIEKNLFDHIQGFDERVGDLDDWGLSLKLKKQKIKSATLPQLATVHEPTNLFEIWKRRYRKGQYLPLLKQFYGPIPQTNLSERTTNYAKHIALLTQSPPQTLALFILKLFDTIPFFLGSLNPARHIDVTNPYTEKHIASNFDQEQQTPAGAYKNYTEITALKKLLGHPHGKILELGAGTGRITQQLTQQGYQITPSDVSPAMLKELKKKNIPNPILIKNSSKLPFQTNQFDHVISLRVIWHIMDKKKREEFFSEAARVSKHTLILDLTNNQKYQNPLLKFLIPKLSPTFFNNTHYFTWQEIENLAQKNHLTIESKLPLEVLPPILIPYQKKLFPLFSNLENLSTKILPPGRNLIRLKKIL